MTAAPDYVVRANTLGDGTSVATSKRSEVRFDSSPTQGDELPGPADLLVTAFAACVLKNVERMGQILPFHWEHASIEVRGERQDSPPKMTRIIYRLEVVTDEPNHRVDLLHRNISRHGTIYNTLSAVCDVSGEIIAIPPAG
ncbi:MAG TPA: OsmC family protein [Microthrixaceae bacterium]|nr:OsmC family protein [Microthrixaceae bacterium]MCB9376661.1 OsmC family protein [Microthrixaceae bacterium]MCO5307099.1 OsmC family protein [Microthrixaceae bacterium]HNI34878.1 OsmC family protein [Microthrixaceae bacterium]HPG14757.1 OsmC family protein [Microthrixaceae bacterium]